jgi:hypothetical protein
MVAVTMMLVSLIAVVAPKTCSYLAGSSVLIIVAGSALLAIVPLRTAIFG